MLDIYFPTVSTQSVANSIKRCLLSPSHIHSLSPSQSLGPAQYGCALHKCYRAGHYSLPVLQKILKQLISLALGLSKPFPSCS